VETSIVLLVLGLINTAFALGMFALAIAGLALTLSIICLLRARRLAKRCDEIEGRLEVLEGG
jgi:predicted membrane-bound spermidine synthase